MLIAKMILPHDECPALYKNNIKYLDLVFLEISVTIKQIAFSTVFRVC